MIQLYTRKSKRKKKKKTQPLLCCIASKDFNFTSLFKSCVPSPKSGIEVLLKTQLEINIVRTPKKLGIIILHLYLSLHGLRI